MLVIDQHLRSDCFYKLDCIYITVHFNEQGYPIYPYNEHTLTFGEGRLRGGAEILIARTNGKRTGITATSEMLRMDTLRRRQFQNTYAVESLCSKGHRITKSVYYIGTK